jgi:hypothetical protein
MKTIFSIYPLGLTALLILFFSSCDRNDPSSDTEPPVIHLIEPEEGDVLKIGADIHFDLELSDNVMLNRYRVEIHNNFDGHSHASSPLKATGEATVDFVFDRSWDVSGQRNADIHHHEILIPANATPGNYHLMVFCTDVAGNEAHLARNIVLSTEGGEEHEHEHAGS